MNKPTTPEAREKRVALLATIATSIMMGLRGAPGLDKYKDKTGELIDECIESAEEIIDLCEKRVDALPKAKDTYNEALNQATWPGKNEGLAWPGKPVGG